MKEEYKDIKGFEGFYKISNYGEVYSLNRFVLSKTGIRFYKGRKLKKAIDGTGYFSIVLCKNSSLITKKIHRLVAKHFIPNQYGKKCVNHKDLNKQNNNIKNLEWCTYKENSNHYQKNKK